MTASPSRRHALFGLALAMAGMVIAPGCATGGGATGAVGPGAKVPDAKVDLLSGGTLELSALQGKVVLLDVWATWCEPCKVELPMLDAMAGRLKDRGIEVVAVSVDEDRANIERFLASRPSWNLTFAHDPGGQLANRLGPAKMPTSYAIDKAGIVRHVNGGFVPEDAPRIENQLIELAR